jgi:hypothetical protein
MPPSTEKWEPKRLPDPRRSRIIPHVASNSPAISLFGRYLAWRCGDTSLSHCAFLRSFHSAHTGWFVCAERIKTEASK